MSRIPEKHGLALSQFLKDIKALNNESAKTHRFSALLGELFPGSKVMMAQRQDTSSFGSGEI